MSAGENSVGATAGGEDIDNRVNAQGTYGACCEGSPMIAEPLFDRALVVMLDVRRGQGQGQDQGPGAARMP